MKRPLIALTALTASFGMMTPAMANPGAAETSDFEVSVMESAAQATNDGPDGPGGVKPTVNWNVDRIDQPSLPLDGVFRPVNRGDGGNVYVMSTGVDRVAELVMRLGMFKNFSSNDAPGQTDCHGSGTKTAAVIAGTTNGVAAEAKIHDIRILDCKGRGSTKNIVNALSWLSAEASKPGSAVKPGVIFAGWGSATNTDILDLYKKLGSQGFTVVAGMDASAKDCGKHDFMHIVASTTKKDRYASNNDGSCADILAPGTGIHSSAPDGKRSRGNSGTLFAAAHVAGVHAMEFASAQGADVVKRVDNRAVTLNTNEAGDNISKKLVQVQTAVSEDPVEESRRYENRTSFVVRPFSRSTSTLNVPEQWDTNTLWLDLNTRCFERLFVSVEAPNGEITKLRRGRNCNEWYGYRSSDAKLPTNSAGEWKLHVANRFGFRHVIINKWGIEIAKDV